MPPENDDDLTTEQEGDSDLIKKLRKELDKQSKRNREQTQKIETLTTDNLIAKAGLEGLKERQLKALKREMSEEEDLTPEKVKGIADELGYTVTKSTETKGEGNNESGESNQPTGEQSSNGEQEVDNNEEITPLQLIERAHREATGRADPNFSEEVKKTKTPSELDALIRSKGAAQGLVHEWDHM